MDLLLDTASELFAELGYEATTTNAIAERAEVSIGSLYRYFPDKQAILKALAARHLEQLRGLYARVFTDDVVYLPLPVLLDRLVDPFLELHLGRPDYAHILLGASVSADIAAAGSVAEDEIQERLTHLFLRVAPRLSKARARLVATVCKGTVKALIAMASEVNDRKHRAKIVAETKQMMLLYFQSVLRR
ncbi:MAG: TetR family transcriptional regulator [Acidobacteria bacterium]|nr:TetR family transcriptional regulator [Acidobacteriota bacterium]